MPFPKKVWDHQVTAMAAQPLDWLWHGFVAPGNLTPLTSQWKAGKTSCCRCFCPGAKRGQLAGLAVKPGKSVVVSEEPLDLWADRARCASVVKTHWIVLLLLVAARPRHVLHGFNSTQRPTFAGFFGNSICALYLTS
jgi:AAA domain